MLIGLHDSEKNNYPNLALMKLSAYHKSKGDIVEFYSSLNKSKYDKIYSSKIFTWTKEKRLPKKTEKGGTGQGIKIKLPNNIELICPDYSLYNCDRSYGFATRGCPNKCKWCFVPKKEGRIKAHAEIKEFLQHNKLVLMDNNILAHDHGIKQIEEIIKLGIKVDFNQGLDARLIDEQVAKLLSKLKWMSPLRMACDSIPQIKYIEKAVYLLRKYNCSPQKYFIYCLLTDDMEDNLERIYFLKGLYLDPYCQPYRDKNGTPPNKKQRDMARWVNHKAIFNSVSWDNYKKIEFKNKKKISKKGLGLL